MSFLKFNKKISQNFNDQHSIRVTKSNRPLLGRFPCILSEQIIIEKISQHFTSPFAVPYMFGMDYYENILIHIAEKAFEQTMLYLVYIQKKKL